MSKRLSGNDKRYLAASLVDVLEQSPNTRWAAWTDGSGCGRGRATGAGVILIWRPSLRTTEGTWMIKLGFAPGQYLAPKGSTNNTAELMAIRIALSVFRPTQPLVKISGNPAHPFLSHRNGDTAAFGKILICSDSEWSIKSLRGEYRHVKKNKELRESCQAAMRRWEQVKFSHVRGHRGHYQNEICDRLAKEARYLAANYNTHVGFTRFDIHVLVEKEEHKASLKNPQLCLPNGNLKILAPKLGPKSLFSRSLGRITKNGEDY